jgi:hypothetical protein
MMLTYLTLSGLAVEPLALLLYAKSKVRYICTNGSCLIGYQLTENQLHTCTYERLTLYPLSY